MFIDESSMNKTSICKLYKCFQEGSKHVKNNEYPRCPSTLTTDDNAENAKKIIINNY